MPTQISWWISVRRWTAVLACFLAIILGTACNASKDELGKYPAPPPTQELATWMARGISTAKPEYPAPIPGPLRGSTKAAPLKTPQATRTPQFNQTTPTTEELPEAVQAARFYLAGHLGLTQRQIELLSWETAIWSTTGLGCMSSEAVAARSPLQGFQILLSARGEAYEVHSDAAGENMCVAEALQPGERVPLQVRTGQEPAELARSHLAGRLGLMLNDVTIVEVQPGEWEDEYLGCARPPGNQPDRAFPRAIQGERILLSARDVTHEYHSGGLWLVYCGIVE